MFHDCIFSRSQDVKYSIQIFKAIVSGFRYIVDSLFTILQHIVFILFSYDHSFCFKHPRLSRLLHVGNDTIFNRVQTKKEVLNSMILFRVCSAITLTFVNGFRLYLLVFFCWTGGTSVVVLLEK